MNRVLQISISRKRDNSRKSINLFFSFLISTLFFTAASAQAPADPSSIIGKIVCGYQGWFTCTGDGSPINRWTHWSPTNPPQPGVAPNPNPNLTFDLYPDVSFYNPASLFQTNFANHGDGAPAKLFSDYKQDVTDKHFELMQANGIDGAAFQRFIWEVLVDPAFKANRDTMAVHVRKAAEKYQRMFYLVYDLSGLGNVPAANDQARFDGIKTDWSTNMIGNLQLTSSPMYAKQGGKPVVQIWGIGYNHIIGTAAIQLDLINWFKAQGCYVIIGVPTGWRTGTGASLAGWINTYKAGNMISPWSVGAYSDQTSTDNFKTNFLTPDLTYCNTNSIAYQPVIFPGFSWYNWNSGTQNQISRNKGQFLWHQATNLRSLGITSAEIAMFDEYDEGTAILSMADGYNMIPTNQYFVTSSADGTYLSSDFYLRLATKVSRVIKGTDASVANVPIPYSVAPIYFRTSNEPKYDPIAVVSTNASAGVSVSSCINSNAQSRRGQYSLKVTGTDGATSHSYAYYNVFDVDIPVTITTDLRFSNYPVNALGQHISVDLLMTDGTFLRNTAAVDMSGVSMKPATARGIVGQWSQTRCNIGQWLSGKTIDKILVDYDYTGGTGTFTGYIDDISIMEESYSVLPVKILSFTAQPIKNDVLVKWISEEQDVRNYRVERSADGVNFQTVYSVLPSLNTGRREYNYTDISIPSDQKNNTFYYRLLVTGTDGELTFSKIQKVMFEQRASFILSLFPNPFTDRIDMTVNTPKDDYIDVVITGVTGNTLVSTKIKVLKGTSKASITNLERLSIGNYFLKFSMANETQTYKIEKIKR